MKSVYYSEFDPFAAQWLRNLIAAGEIPDGDVDERSIVDVQSSDLKGYTQIHMFAGIGGWALALRQAGWPETRPVFTGSCPCQSFSTAGKREGGGDDRHLWPEMLRLARELRPERILGEQVEGAVSLGWLDGVSSDLEAEGYTVGSVVLGAHSIGAPHIRQRIYWVADSTNGGRKQRIHLNEEGTERAAKTGREVQRLRIADIAANCGPRILAHAPSTRWNGGGCKAGERPTDEPQRLLGTGGVEHSPRDGREQWGSESGGRSAVGGRGAGGVGQPEGDGCGSAKDAGSHLQGEGGGRRERKPGGSGLFDGMGHSFQPRLEGHAGNGENGDQPGRLDAHTARPASPTSFWSDSIAIPCTDGKLRRVPSPEPKIFGVVAGISAGVDRPCPDRFPLAPPSKGRAGRLKGIGNSINIPLAVEFIRAADEAISDCAARRLRGSA